MLIYNVDVSDGLNNGAKGVVLDFTRNGNDITHVVVKFIIMKLAKNCEKSNQPHLKPHTKKECPLRGYHIHIR